LILSSCGRKGGGVARAHMAWPIHNYIGRAPAPGTTLNGAPCVYMRMQREPKTGHSGGSHFGLYFVFLICGLLYGC